MINKPDILGRKQLQPLILAKFYGFDPEMDIDWEVLGIGCQAQHDKDCKELLGQFVNLIDTILESWRDSNSIQIHSILGQLRELGQVIQSQLGEA